MKFFIMIVIVSLMSVASGDVFAAKSYKAMQVILQGQAYLIGKRSSKKLDRKITQVYQIYIAESTSKKNKAKARSLVIRLSDKFKKAYPHDEISIFKKGKKKTKVKKVKIKIEKKNNTGGGAR